MRPGLLGTGTHRAPVGSGKVSGTTAVACIVQSHADSCSTLAKMLTVVCYIVAVSYLAFFITYAFRSTARAKRDAHLAGKAQLPQACS